MLQTHINFVEFSAEEEGEGVEPQLGRGVGPGLQPLVSGSGPEREQVAELQSPAQGPQGHQGPQAGPQPQAAPHHGHRGCADAAGVCVSQAGEEARR